MMASKKDGVIYVGVTSDLVKRCHEHRCALIQGFTRKYYVRRLVYFEVFKDVEAAILQEKRLKRWQRTWKKELIEKDNPDWIDLAGQL